MTDRLTYGSDGVRRGAILSDDDDQLYRYCLTRSWGAGEVPRQQVTFVMLNPSTADGLHDDPTIRRCIRFARDWLFTDLVVVNLFAYRATDPRELATAYREGHDVAGTDNADYVSVAMSDARLVVAAWGATSLPYTLERDRAIWRSKLEHDGAKCLGKTKAGHPRHPLYVRADAPLVDL